MLVHFVAAAFWLTRHSTTHSEGKMLSKWLDAARRRCGGAFPRPEARKQMEEFAERMRARKLKKAKDK
jgi:hypothetical protein